MEVIFKTIMENFKEVCFILELKYIRKEDCLKIKFWWQRIIVFKIIKLNQDIY